MLRQLFRQGFNSWNFYHCNIDENTVKAVLDAIATNGMKEAGYEYVNIDDCARSLPHSLPIVVATCHATKPVPATAFCFVSHDKETAAFRVSRQGNFCRCRLAGGTL